MDKGWEGERKGGKEGGMEGELKGREGGWKDGERKEVSLCLEGAGVCSDQLTWLLELGNPGFQDQSIK